MLCFVEIVRVRLSLMHVVVRLSPHHRAPPKCLMHYGQLLYVHSDNGASMKAGKTLALLSRSGVTFSHSRPRVSNDNPYSEPLFRTLKYSGDYLYPRDGFESLEQAQHWFDGFVEHYNEHHRHRGTRMVTPGQRYRGEDVEILKRRRQTMKVAREKALRRWIQGKMLNCDPVGVVWLNPENGQLEEVIPAGHA